MYNTIEWNAGAIFGVTCGITFALVQCYFFASYFFALNTVFGMFGG